MMRKNWAKRYGIKRTDKMLFGIFLDTGSNKQGSAKWLGTTFNRMTYPEAARSAEHRFKEYNRKNIIIIPLNR